MTYLATTRGALMRGSTTNATGDEVDDTGAPVAGWDDFPVGLVEKSKAVYDPASGTRRTVRVVAARVPVALPVAEGDRLRDNRTGIIYAIVEQVVVPRSLAGQSSRTLDLKRTGEA